MTEDFLQFLWQYKLFDENHLSVQSGEEVEVISVGRKNVDAGPDFFNSKIRIGTIVQVGNVEMHIRSSEWNTHGHQDDRAYNNVILHVVAEYDKPVYSIDGREIPTLVLPVDKKYVEQYELLEKSTHTIACEPYLPFVDDIVKQQVVNRCTIERLESKIESVKDILKATHNDWSSLLYRLVARYFGQKINADPFEQVAMRLPLNYLARHKDNLLQVEAMLFGVAGMLETEHEEEYPQKLKREWEVLSHKFMLTPIDVSQWKFLRLRPVNFPTLRIAELATLIYQSRHLFDYILNLKDLKTLQDLFLVEASAYWDTHYTFEKKSTKRKKTAGIQLVNTVIINAVIPVLFTYGEVHFSDIIKNKALRWLEELPPEKNAITKRYQTLGFEMKSAFDTQGVLALQDAYCSHVNCLQCGIGHAIIKKVDQ